MAVKHPTRRVKASLEVVSEGAFAKNYDQVSPGANIALRVSCDPSTINFGLAMKYLSHGTFLCCLSTGFGTCFLPSRSPQSRFPSPVFCGYSYMSQWLLVRFHSIVLLLSCNPPFLLSPIYVFREIIQSSTEDKTRVQTPASTSKPVHFIPFHFQSEF